MKQLKKMMLFTVLLIFSTAIINAQKKDNTKVLALFPKALPGMKRHVIFPKEKIDENLYEIEIIPGKFILVDNCNNNFILGEWENRKLQDCNYSYYIFTPEGINSTRMACRGGKKNSSVSGQKIRMPYNSLYPVVVYIPAGFEIKHKVLKVED